jgi:archaellum component FlaC
MADVNTNGVERRIDELDAKFSKRFGKVDVRFDKIDARFDRMDLDICESFAEHRRLVLETTDALKRDLTQTIESGLQGVRTEMRERFEAVDHRLESVDRRFEGVDQRFDGVDQRFDGVDQRLEGVDRRLVSLENRIEAQGLTTIERFDTLEGKLDAFTEAQAAVNTRILKRLGA